MDRQLTQEERTMEVGGTALPPGYWARPATLEDVQAAVELFNQCSLNLLGVESFRADETRAEWMTPGFSLETDTRVIIAPDGSLASYQEVWDPGEPHTVLHSWGRVSPKHTGLGIGGDQLEWAEGRARQAIDMAPPEARVSLAAGLLSIDEAAQALYGQRGFQLIRDYFRMVIELNGRLPGTEWPEGIRVRRMVVNQDEWAIFSASREAFRDHWGFIERPAEEEFERWKAHNFSRPDFDPSLWFLAMDGEQIAGMSLCRGQSNDDPDMGWISTLAVRQPWRRRGLGLALLHYSFAEFRRRGRARVGLGVDAENLSGALRLYEKIGMQSDPAWQFSVYEKELRPGVNLARQEL